MNHFRDDELSIAQIQDQQLKMMLMENRVHLCLVVMKMMKLKIWIFIQSEARWATMDEGALNAYIDKSLEATLDAKTSRNWKNLEIKWQQQRAGQVHLLSLLLMLVRLLALVMLELLVLLLILLVLYPSPNIIKSFYSSYYCYSFNSTIACWNI